MPFAFSASCADAPPPAARAESGNNVSPAAMDRSVRDVLARREFAWRGPRADKPPDADDSREGAIARFFKRIGQKIDDWMSILRRWFSRDREQPAAPRPSSSGGLPTFAGFGLQPLLYVLVAACAAAVLVLLYRGWRARSAGRALAGKELPATAATPDLADESVLADQLPEDEWLALARELLARGERRLALRAFYLSALSNLGGHGFLAIARHKSNRDYQGELRRRARERGTLQAIFGQLVGRFERVWYGTHPADDALLTAFQDDRARLSAELAPPTPAVGALAS